MSRIIGIDPTAVYSALQIQRGEAPGLGTRGWDAAGKEYLLLSGSATIVNGDVAFFDAAWAATLLSTGNDAVNQMYAIARAGMVSGQNGWFQIWGQGLVRAAAAAVAGATLVATATPGAVDDVALAGLFPIRGLSFLTAPGGAGTFNAFINHPQSDFEVHA